LLLPMVLFLKIWPRDLWLRFKFQRLDAFMDSKWPWKIFTQRLILFWLILTSLIQLKRISFSQLLIQFHLLLKKLNGLSNGLVLTIVLQRELSLLLVSRESFSLEVSVLFSGSKKEVWCQDSLSQMNWFQEMKACTPTSLVYFINT